MKSTPLCLEWRKSHSTQHYLIRTLDYLWALELCALACRASLSTSQVLHPALVALLISPSPLRPVNPANLSRSVAAVWDRLS